MKTAVKGSWALSLIMVALLLSASLLAEATGNFVTVSLPKGVSIDLPKNWIILSNNQRITLDTFVESRLDLSGIEQPISELLFAANFYDDSGNTIGILNIRYYPQIDISQAEARAATNQDVQELDVVLEENMVKEMTSFGMSITSWSGTTKKEINGITAFITEYSRASLKGSGDFRVRLVRVFARDKSFTLTVSYLDSASLFMRPITDRIIDSLKNADIAGSKSPAASSSVGDRPGRSSIMTDLYGEQWGLVLLVSVLITWGLGLAPPLLIRFVFLRRPIGKGYAIGIVALFWIFGIFLSTALGSQSKSHGALALVAFASYAILRKGAKKAVLPT